MQIPHNAVDRPLRSIKKIFTSTGFLTYQRLLDRRGYLMASFVMSPLCPMIGTPLLYWTM